MRNTQTKNMVGFYKNDGSTRTNFKLGGNIMNKTLGLIKGRHELPVNEYVFENEVNMFTRNELRKVAADRLSKLLPKVEMSYSYDRNGIAHDYKTTEAKVTLYITGLTIATLTVMELLHERGWDVEVMGFDPKNNTYYSQGVFKSWIE